MEVVGVFEDALLAGHDDKVDRADVRAELGHASASDDRQYCMQHTGLHSPGVGDNGDAKLGSEEEHAQDLVHAGEAERVELKSIESFGLEQLLEHDPVVDVLARSDTDAVRLERLADLGVTEDVVGRGGLLNEASPVVRSLAEGFKAGQLTRG